MTRNCDQCGRPYIAKSSKSRTCDDTCRKRMSRGTAACDYRVSGHADVTKPSGLAPESTNDLLIATKAELEAAGRLDSALGKAAVRLAEVIGRSGETASGVASLTREWRAVMAEATRGASVASSLTDELRVRRDAKRAAAG